MVRIHILSLDGGSIHTIYTATMAYAHWPLAPMANGHWPFCCINRYTSYTHGVKAFQELYSYTALYTIHPLQHPSVRNSRPNLAYFRILPPYAGSARLLRAPRRGRGALTHRFIADGARALQPTRLTPYNMVYFTTTLTILAVSSRPQQESYRYSRRLTYRPDSDVM